MKCAFEIILAILTVVSVACCSTDESCVWNYRCCAFKETNGEVSCVKMCEPEITCSTAKESEDNDIENDPDAPSALRAVACRAGFQFYNGRCRRVLGKSRDLK